MGANEVSLSVIGVPNAAECLTSGISLAMWMLSVVCSWEHRSQSAAHDGNNARKSRARLEQALEYPRPGGEGASDA